VVEDGATSQNSRIALVVVGMLLWGIAVLPSPLRGALAVISGGALVAGGIVLITTSI
jgi:hypothetical protein